jgi:hypothetical protein
MRVLVDRVEVVAVRQVLEFFLVEQVIHPILLHLKVITAVTVERRLLVLQAEVVAERRR